MATKAYLLCRISHNQGILHTFLLSFISASLIAGPQSNPGKKHWPHAYDLLDVKWSIRIFHEKREIEGEVTNTLTALADNATLLFDACQMEIGDVFVDGQPASKSVSKETVLVVPKNRKLKTGETVRVTIHYKANPESGIYFVQKEHAYPAKHDMVFTQGEMEDTRYWIPTYDYPDDKATSEGIIEVPAEWTTLSNGKLVESKDNPDHRTKTFRWKMDQPHSTYLISLVAGPMTEIPDGNSPVPTSIFVPKGLEPWAKEAFGGTDKIVQFYGELTGFKYPWVKFSQVAVPEFFYGGMENTTAVTQNISAIFPPGVKPLRSATGLVAHELAHQWFGDTVTATNWSEVWLNEGFATFLPMFWTRKSEGAAAYEHERWGVFQGALGASLSDERPVVWTDYKDALDMFDGHIYAGGAARMWMLMDKVGEAKFWKAIGSFLEANKFKNVDTKLFFDHMSKETGMDLKRFKEDWFYRGGAPKLVVSRSGSKFTVLQNGQAFDLNLDVWVLEAQKWTKKQIRTAQREVTIDLGTTGLALLDPEGKCMAEVKYAKPFDANQVLTMVSAMDAVAMQISTVARATSAFTGKDWPRLAKLIKDPALLAQVIGTMGADSDVDLLEYTKNPAPEVIEAAIHALGKSSAKPEIVARLKEIYQTASNPVLQHSAYAELLSMTKDRKLYMEGWAKDSFEDGFRTTALQWLAGNFKDEGRDACIKVLQHPQNETIRIKAIELLGSLRDSEGEKKVLNALVAELDKGGYRAKLSAIEALGTYGDDGAKPALKRFLYSTQIFFRRAAQSALARIG